MEKKRKPRETFKKQLKRVALIEYSTGKSPNQIFEDLGIEIKSEDKKYASKLIHKWKNEFLNNVGHYGHFEAELDEKLLLHEINLINFDN